MKMDKIYQQKMERYSEEYVFENCEREREVFLVKDAYQKGWHDALQNQWISVEEALPPSDDRLKSISIDVMVKNEYGKVTSAWYDYERKEWHLSYGEIAGDDLIDSKITHWMQIPELKGGEK